MSKYVLGAFGNEMCQKATMVLSPYHSIVETGLIHVNPILESLQL